jgi:D-arabinose 1-dehydrogenase-like Zn-dependent alcohol dehydrogenase
MRAPLYETTLNLVREFAPPDPLPDEALIHVPLAGICNTGLEIARGYMGGIVGPMILGHEFVGQVEAAPDETWIGQR